MYSLRALYSLCTHLNLSPGSVFSLYISEVINKKTFTQYSSLYFLSLVLCVHLDEVCALLSDPNNWY